MRLNWMLILGVFLLPLSVFAGELQFESRSAGRGMVEIYQLTMQLEPGDEGYTSAEASPLPISSDSSTQTLCQMAGYSGTVERVQTESLFNAEGLYLGAQVRSDQSVVVATLQCDEDCALFQNNIASIICRRLLVPLLQCAYRLNWVRIADRKYKSTIRPETADRTP